MADRMRGSYLGRLLSVSWRTRIDDHFCAALAAKLNMDSIIRVESPELSAVIEIFGRFPPPNSGTREDSDAPNSLMNASGTPAFSEKSKGTSRRSLLLLPSRFVAGNPHTRGAKPMR